MPYEEFATAYAAMSNDELLSALQKPKKLSLEASAALSSELVRRGIHAANQGPQKQQKAPESKIHGSLFVASHWGIGRWHFGKASRTFDPRTGLERFRTTLFVVVLWFPLIPTGSYLIEKRPGYFTNKITILKKLPLSWAQIVRVWAVAGCGLLAVIWMLTRL